MSLMVKLHKGRECQNSDNSLPQSGIHRGNDSKSRTDPVIAKVMKLADHYYNPDPLVRLIGPVNESEIWLKINLLKH